MQPINFTLQLDGATAATVHNGMSAQIDECGASQFRIENGFFRENVTTNGNSRFIGGKPHKFGYALKVGSHRFIEKHWVDFFVSASTGDAGQV